MLRFSLIASPCRIALLRCNKKKKTKKEERKNNNVKKSVAYLQVEALSNYSQH